MTTMPAGPVWLALLGLAFGGCGEPPAAAPSIQDAPGAIRIFEHFWSHKLLPGLGESQKQLALLLSDKLSENLGAGPSRFEDFRRELEGSLTPAERRTSILYGTPEALPREGPCWCVSSGGAFRCEIRACLDPRTGEVVVVWIVPEG